MLAPLRSPCIVSLALTVNLCSPLQPKVAFTTKIYHHGIDASGKLCLGELQKKENGGSWCVVQEEGGGGGGGAHLLPARASSPRCRDPACKIAQIMGLIQSLLM